MNIVKANHQGFCEGVERAYQMALATIKDDTKPKPIYLLGELVHNEEVTKLLEALGIIILKGSTRLQMLDKINSGTVIFSAHGVSSLVYETAKKKGLTVVDATCPIVKKQEEIMAGKIHNNEEIIYLGNKDHPETEVALSLNTVKKQVYLYPDYPSNHNLSNVTLFSQTTMTKIARDTSYLSLKKKLPQLNLSIFLCQKTTLRQEELNKLQLNESEGIVIIGDKKSNNATMLYELAKKKTNNAYFINSIEEVSTIDPHLSKVYLFSSTSSPNFLIEEIEDEIARLS
jgi:4-hydroxy-3-methylbut-2-enyl diphosphate reductase